MENSGENEERYTIAICAKRGPNRVWHPNCWPAAE